MDGITMNDYERLKKQFDKNVTELQERCPHTEWQWMVYEWAPAHASGSVKVCLNCNKHLAKSNKFLGYTNWPKNTELEG